MWEILTKSIPFPFISVHENEKFREINLSSIKQEIQILKMETILNPGLLPIPAANAMLLVGSKMKECDCEFPLAHFLLISGIVGL